MIQAFGLGTVLTLKATRQTRLLFRLGVVSFVVAAITIVSFAYAWGDEGVAWGLVAESVVTLATLFWAQRFVARSFAPVDPVEAVTA
jgi:Na+-driven multidrug efflux pump